MLWILNTSLISKSSLTLYGVVIKAKSIVPSSTLWRRLLDESVYILTFMWVYFFFNSSRILNKKHSNDVAVAPIWIVVSFKAFADISASIFSNCLKGVLILSYNLFPSLVNMTPFFERKNKVVLYSFSILEIIFSCQFHVLWWGCWHLDYIFKCW